MLTALATATAPGTPNTGFFSSTLANPFVVLALGAASIAMMVIGRFSLLKSRR